MRTKTVDDFLEHTLPRGDCLEWTRCLNTDGYPRCLWRGNSNGKVHRIVYGLIHHKECLVDKVIRHTCDNPLCINPTHLVSGTPRDNMKDRDLRGRSGTTKITAKEVALIRTMWATGKYTQVQLGELFNVNYRTISYIVRKLTWRWVP